VTGEEVLWPGLLPVPPFGGAETLALIARRTSVDSILYRRAAIRRSGEERAQRQIEAAYAEALVGFGAYAAEPTKGLEAAGEALEAIRRSRSWRYTAPLRQLGRALRPGR
jgi:hypothetical protein